MGKITLLLLILGINLVACSQQAEEQAKRQANYPAEKEKALALQAELAAKYAEASPENKAQILAEAKQELF